MGRLILLALVVLAAVWLVRRALREREPPGAPGAPGDLVACAHCGVHLPALEARHADGQPYCSEAHARLGPRRP